MGIDLTTYAAGVQPPADKDHPIYDFPTNEDYPDVHLSSQEICIRLHMLERKVIWMEHQLQKRKLLSLMLSLLHLLKREKPLMTKLSEF